VVAESLAAGRHVVLAVGACRVIPLSRESARPDPDLSAAIAAGMGELARLILASGGAGGLVLTGGDIASRVLQALQATTVDVLGEVDPGIPFGRLQDGL